MDKLKHPREIRSPNLSAIVDRIHPDVEPLIDTEAEEPALLEKAIRANIRASMNQLRNSWKILESLIRDDGLVIVGAGYSLENGLVEFFDD